MEYIFDTHAHYDDEAFDEDRESLIGSLREKGIGIFMQTSGGRISWPWRKNIPFFTGLWGSIPMRQRI